MPPCKEKPWQTKNISISYVEFIFKNEKNCPRFLMEFCWELPKVPSLTKMTRKPSLPSLISWLALYLEVLHQIKIHYYSKFHFRVHRYSLNVPAWQHRPSHSCSTHCAWGQAGRGRGVHPLRGEAREVRHDHAFLWIFWRSHEAFRKVASHDYWTEKKFEHIWGCDGWESCGMMCQGSKHS